MPCTCNNRKLTINAIMKGDPTRTKTLRNKFASDMGRRYATVSSKIWDAVVTQDVFGLNEAQTIFNASSGLQPRAFAFDTDAGKVAGFMNWLSAEVDDTIVRIAPRDKLIREMARLFGYMKVGTHVREHMRDGIRYLMKQGVANEACDTVSLVGR